MVRSRTAWYRRMDAFERSALGFPIVFTLTIALPLLWRDPNLTFYGLGVGILAVGIFIGFAEERKKVAFSMGFVAAVGGVWLGFLIFVPVVYVLTETATLVGLLLAVGVGFALGLAFGFVAGIACGSAAMLSCGVSTGRRKRKSLPLPDSDTIE